MEGKIDSLVALVENMNVRLAAVEKRNMLGTQDAQQPKQHASFADAVRSYNTRTQTQATRTRTYNQDTHTNTQTRGPRQFTNSNRHGDRGQQRSSSISSRPRTHQYAQQQQQQQPRPSTANTTVPNMDLAKKLYRAVQLRSHERTWASCPTGVSKQVNGLISSITPPLPNVSFIQELQSLEAYITDRTKSIVQDHIKCRLHEVRQSLADSGSEELQAAISLARNQLMKFQGKLPAYLREQWLREEAWLVGTEVHVTEDRPTARTAEQEPAPVVQASVAAGQLGEAATETAAAAATQVEQVFTPVNTPRARKRSNNQISKSPEAANNLINNNKTCVVTLNRFDVLNSLSVVESPSKRLQRCTKSDTTRAVRNINNNINNSNSNNTVDTVVARAEVVGEESSDSDSVLPVVEDAVEEVVAAASPLQLQLPSSPSSSDVTHLGHIETHETASRGRNHWELTTRTEARVIIVADSNMKLVNEIPEDFELHVYPGCKLEDVDRMLRSATLLPENRHILIAVGINNRSDPPSRIPGRLSTVMDVVRGQLRRECHFLGISHRSLPDLQTDNMKLLNSLAKSKLRDAFIEPLPTEQVELQQSGKGDYIHHTVITISRIISSIMNHFLL